MHNPTSFFKFWPINLCSVANKIFSKIIITRLSRVIHKMISQEQGAFVSGRKIFENITLAYEMVHSLNRKTIDGNVSAKITCPRLMIVFTRISFRRFYI